MSEQLVRELQSLKVDHEFFIGIDSDGCVFDTMEFKQKKCFHPHIIRIWQLEAIADYVCETAQFVNLYSHWRGSNRFPALAKVFDLLRERPEVQASGVDVPELISLKKWIEEETKLGNPVLAEKAEATGDSELKTILEWSLAVSATVAELAKGIAPFDFVRESLTKAQDYADMIVVSQTPLEALAREWQEHNLDGHVKIIAGQEHGTKTEHLRFATSGKYAANNVLMIGDAPGDRKAAEANNALFYPIIAGKENESWEKFYKEALEKFFNGTYSGEYQQALARDFEASLPSVPPWNK